MPGALGIGGERSPKLAGALEVAEPSGDRLGLAQRLLRRRLLVAAVDGGGVGGVALDRSGRALRRQLGCVGGADLLADRLTFDRQALVVSGEGRGSGLEGDLDARVERGVEQRREDLLLVLRLGLEELLEPALRQHDDLAELLAAKARMLSAALVASVQPSADGLLGAGAPSADVASRQTVAACIWVVVPSPRLRGRSCCGLRTTR